MRVASGSSSLWMTTLLEARSNHVGGGSLHMKHAFVSTVKWNVFRQRLYGDLTFLMTALELLTASQPRLPLMVLVLRDSELAQIAQLQQIALGRKPCSELPDCDLAGICRGVGVEHLVLHQNAVVEGTLRKAFAVTRSGCPVVVEVASNYSQKTYFTRGVVRTNFGRLPWLDRIRYVLRVLGRKPT